MSNTGGKAAGLRLLESMKASVPSWIALSYDSANSISDSMLDSIIAKFAPTDLLAVRSSATNEDGMEKSFAGVYESKLNVAPVRSDLGRAIRQVLESGAAGRVAEYAETNDEIAVVIQKMIAPIISGVAFTSAMDVNGQDAVLVECVNGLADKLVSGAVTPTQIKVPVRDKKIIFDAVQISGTLISRLEKITLLLHEIQKIIKASNNPLDLEWAIDESNVWFVQARPITKKVLIKNKTAGTALPVGGGIANGAAFVIAETEYETSREFINARLAEFPKGAILVARYTESSFIPAMKRAKGIITETGGILSHAAILARELGLPCIINYPNATAKFKTGDEIIMNGDTGEVNGEGCAVNESSWFDEAFLFDQMFKVPTKNGYVFIEPLPNKLNVIAPMGNDDTESWIRQEFGVQPDIIRNNYKFGAYKENKFRKKLPGYRRIMEQAHKVAESGSARAVHKFYNDTINFIKKYIILENTSKNAAAKFYYNEIIAGPYVILDVIFPSAIALRQMYYHTVFLRNAAGKTFRDFLSGVKIKGIPKSYYDFARAVADSRNSIWGIIKEMHPLLADYWTNGIQGKLMKEALEAVGVESGMHSYEILSDNFGKIKKML
jgi:pyruvate,water dikinase